MEGETGSHQRRRERDSRDSSSRAFEKQKPRKKSSEVASRSDQMKPSQNGQSESGDAIAQKVVRPSVLRQCRHSKSSQANKSIACG